MPRRTYATTATYDDLYGTGAAAAAGVTDNLLAEATITVDELLIGATYPVADTADGHSMPTRARDVEALAHATCAQARWSASTGDTTGEGAVPVVQSASIGSVSWSTGEGGTLPGGAGTTGSGRLVAAATLSVLRVHGLVPVTACLRG